MREPKSVPISVATDLSPVLPFPNGVGSQLQDAILLAHLGN